MRTIDADAALKALRKCQTYLYDARDPELKIELSSAEAAINNLPTIQPVATDTNVGDKISKFIDGLEETFAYIREREGGDSVCGLCEYDGAYMGQSGDWCNECPGFNRDDCFKLSDETRKKWTDEIIKALPTIQPEPQWIPVSERVPEEPYGCLVTVWDTNPVTMDEFENILPYFVGWDGEQWNDGDGEQCPFEVIAWMPLPEPYVERRTDG